VSKSNLAKGRIADLSHSHLAAANGLFRSWSHLIQVRVSQQTASQSVQPLKLHSMSANTQTHRPRYVWHLSQ